MTITLSQQQENAIKAMRAWYLGNNIDQSQFPTAIYKHSFILNGYAGTGKTTIAKLLPEMVTEDIEKSVIYTAFTGKAALQLRRKGCENATTLHKLLYSPMEKDRTRLLELTNALKNELLQNPLGDSPRAKELKGNIHQERRRVSTPSWQLKTPDLPIEVKLIVVDESSMIDAKLYNDLAALGKKIVFLGDPFQLPPVFGVSPVMQQEPDFVLTEVHRQALDNSVLRAATELRNGEYPRQGSDENFQIVTAKSANYETYASADQVLCGRNATRRELNRRMRRRLVEIGKVELSTLPASRGDKIVFLRNDHDEGVFNGATATLTSVIDDSQDDMDMLLIDAEGDEKLFSYQVWSGILEGREIAEAPRKTQIIDFAYSLTVHKAQGSEWPHVVVHQEPIGHGTDALRWLYTAITRAQEKCIVIDKDRT